MGHLRKDLEFSHLERLGSNVKDADMGVDTAHASLPQLVTFRDPL